MSFPGSLRLTRLVSCLGVLSLGLAAATTAGAQTADSWSSEGTSTRSSQQDDGWIGPYVRFGVGVGGIDFDDKIDGADIDSGASGGFNLSGGYRAMPWLAVEGDLTLLGGQNNVEVNDNNDEDSEFWAVTIGPKLYPLGLIDSENIPDTIQPYAFVGIGGGEFEIDDAEKKTFAARFILGLDVWIDEQFGLYVEGGGFATDDDDLGGAGLVSVGGLVRF